MKTGMAPMNYRCTDLPKSLEGWPLAFWTQGFELIETMTCLISYFLSAVSGSNSEDLKERYPNPAQLADILESIPEVELRRRDGGSNGVLLQRGEES